MKPSTYKRGMPRLLHGDDTNGALLRWPIGILSDERPAGRGCEASLSPTGVSIFQNTKAFHTADIIIKQIAFLQANSLSPLMSPSAMRIASLHIPAKIDNNLLASILAAVVCVQWLG